MTPPRPWNAPVAHDLPDSVSSTSLHRYLLYLLRSHDGHVEFHWVRAHNGDANNELADLLAKEAALSNANIFSLATLEPPPNWIDSGPVLNRQPLASLTDYIIDATASRPV